MKKFLASLCLFLTPTSAFAALPDAAAGEKAYSSMCVACHGTDLQGNAAIKAPALTQFSRKEIITVLETGKDLKTGEPIQLMAPFVAQLKDDKQKRINIAEYIASKSKPAKKK